MPAGSDPRPYPGSESSQHHMFPRKIQERCCSSCCELICFLPPGLSSVPRHYRSAQGLMQEPCFPSQDTSGHWDNRRTTGLTSLLKIPVQHTSSAALQAPQVSQPSTASENRHLQTHLVQNTVLQEDKTEVMSTCLVSHDRCSFPLKGKHL